MKIDEELLYKDNNTQLVFKVFKLYNKQYYMKSDADKDNRHITVALIEDDIDISSMYVRRFEMEGGFSVKVANNGLEGVKLLKSYHPDVVLLDIMMPKMSGLETLQHIRKLPGGDKLKVIALTNMNDPETVKAVEALGVVQHIVKANSSPGIIVETVRSVSGINH